MKERPILFNGAMVRAILSGQKTQTRRCMKPQPNLTPEWDSERKIAEFYMADECVGTVTCPYGQPGDRLWVRESFRLGTSDDCACYDPCDCKSGTPIYRASGDQHENEKWKPSIHMPRWACRIVLEIVSVRVERLNDISEADALEEGITYNDIPNNGLDPMRARTWFRGLWSEINGPESWNANPWVWVVEFKRVQQ